MRKGWILPIIINASAPLCSVQGFVQLWWSTKSGKVLTSKDGQKKTAEIRLSLKIWSDLSGNLLDWKIKPAQKCKQSCSSWSGHFYSGNKHSFGLKSSFSPSLWLKPLHHSITVEIDPTPSLPRNEQAVKKMDGWQTVKCMYYELLTGESHPGS